MDFVDDSPQGREHRPQHIPPPGQAAAPRQKCQHKQQIQDGKLNQVQRFLDMIIPP